MIAGLPFWAAPAPADQRVAADHNSSAMRIEVAPDGGMIISYERPRAGLKAAGIAPGTVLFRGRIDGGRIEGEAHAFKKGCDAAPYRVKGTLEGDRITLNGPGPVRAGCRVERLDPASPHATLVFTGARDAFATLGSPAGNAPSGKSAGLRDSILRDPYRFVVSGAQVWRELRPEPDERPIDMFHLDTCTMGYGDLGDGSPDDLFLTWVMETAFYNFQTAKDLEEAGYPEQVWRPALDRLNKARVDVLLDHRRKGLDLSDETSVRKPIIPQEKQLVAALEAYRVGHPWLPPPEPVSEGCGGGFVGDVRLATDPAGGVIRVIRDFFFKLCAASQIPPYSDQCDKWVVAAADEPILVGLYYYTARWPDGHTECDRIDISADAETSGRVVKIAQSGRTCPQ
jgi:hypothetical protein